MTAPEQLKSAVDVLSVSTVVATIAGWLPAIAALATLIWTVIRIFETRTVRGWMRRRRCRAATAKCPLICTPDLGCEDYADKRFPLKDMRLSDKERDI